MNQQKPHTGTRRRGAELDDALLTAAWEQLVAAGYHDFTIEAVAERARTSRPVLYRRWATRAELAIAAMRHSGFPEPVDAPDTGTLRGDLLAILREASDKRAGLAAQFSVLIAEHYSETGTTLEQLRQELFADRPTAIDGVLDRAVARGEIDPARLTPRLRRLPGDLMRHELLTNMRPMSDETITELVDEVILPLLTARTI